MSLFNSLTSLIGAAEGEAANHPATAGVADFINNQPGGLSGLVQQFHDNGLGETVQSWIGNGGNLPVSGEQISQVLGADQVDALAAKVGLPAGVASELLAKLLPAAVNKLTPDGQVPQS